MIQIFVVKRIGSICYTLPYTVLSLGRGLELNIGQIASALLLS